MGNPQCGRICSRIVFKIIYHHIDILIRITIFEYIYRIRRYKLITVDLILFRVLNIPTLECSKYSGSDAAYKREIHIYTLALSLAEFVNSRHLRQTALADILQRLIPRCTWKMTGNL